MHSLEKYQWHGIRDTYGFKSLIEVLEYGSRITLILPLTFKIKISNIKSILHWFYI